jgi:pteridine reductase
MQTQRVALVTGAGKRRIGSYVAEALAQRGYAVAIHYHQSAAAAQVTAERCAAFGVPTKLCAADVTDETTTRNMVQEITQAFGRIDVLVNCAAIWERKRLEEVTAADVRRHFEVNTLGTFICSQQVGLAMVAQPEGGSIIMLGDWAEARPYLDYAAYFPSKGGVSAMTRSLAVELASRNPRIRVNCVQPGPVMLPNDLPPAEKDRAIRATLVKREGHPSHVVQAVLQFIDNDFLTGVCLPVDGGRTLHTADADRG